MNRLPGHSAQRFRWRIRRALPRAHVFSHRLRRPGIRLVPVTAHTRVRRGQHVAQIGAGNGETMVTPRVHDHIGSSGHVTLNALRARSVRRMCVMFRGVKRLRSVALRAERVAFEFQSGRMGIMAVGAEDAFGGHFALEERSDFEDFIVDLSIDKIQAVLR